MDKKVAFKIWDQLISNKEEMFHFLRQLIEIETPSHHKGAQLDIFGLIKKKLESLGFYVLHMPGNNTGGYLFARPLKRIKNNPIQLLIGHCDTVWDINTIQDMPIIQHNEKMYGPGIYDMKAGITQIMYAIQTIQKLSLTMSVTPVILINSDEEIGSKESTVIIKRLARIANRALILEPPLGIEGKLKTARKGIGRFIVKVKGKAAHAGLDPGKGVNAIV